MFRKYPTDLDEAIREALQEDPAPRYVPLFGTIPAKVGKEPMDIGAMDAHPGTRRPRIGCPLDKSRLTCRRCQRVGHIAAECRASAPVPAKINRPAC